MCDSQGTALRLERKTVLERRGGSAAVVPGAAAGPASTASWLVTLTGPASVSPPVKQRPHRLVLLGGAPLKARSKQGIECTVLILGCAGSQEAAVGGPSRSAVSGGLVAEG